MKHLTALLCIALSLAAMLQGSAIATPPSIVDLCQQQQQPIQGRKHGFLAGNVTYYVGGFYASWQLIEHETLGLTHPFYHDLRSRGVGLVKSSGTGPRNTGLGNDFSGWEFYKDTRVLYGSVVLDGMSHRHPVPDRMLWRPDRMICEYTVAGVRLREEKFIAVNDAACSIITSEKPVILRFDGRSFFGRHSVSSSATIRHDVNHNCIHILEGGTTRCRPDTDRSERIGPVMYQDMSTVLTASHRFESEPQFQQLENGAWKYTIDLPCDAQGVAVVWAMHDDFTTALNRAESLLGRSRDAQRPAVPQPLQHSPSQSRSAGDRKTSTRTSEQTPSRKSNFGVNSVVSARKAMADKTLAVNQLLNKQIPRFRCSDQRFNAIYDFLWSLYLMYDIDVQKGWETEPHTQTAVNNFLGIHRYDATFQIPVGAWVSDKRRYAWGNVLTWKHLYTDGYYRRSSDGSIALSDNKGTTWHSGIYGHELSEHVLGAWRVYQHSGEVEFLRRCYEGYFREVFHDRIPPFFSNHFEVARVLEMMAVITGHEDDVEHWRQLVPQDEGSIRNWFNQRWQVNGHHNFFAGPRNGMLMTTGFWHMRSPHFPREYAEQMVRSWAIDRRNGFYGRFFPLAMARKSMQTFQSQADSAFGYTPDTAYFTLSGLFRQNLRDPAWKLTLNHIENYNFHPEWKIPVAPEAYRRDGRLFGDQYSNFNAGKLLLFLEGLAGLDYSLPERTLTVSDAMPPPWTWMEVRIPMRLPGETLVHWPTIRIERRRTESGFRKTIRVDDCPLQISIRPWTEDNENAAITAQPPPVIRKTVPDRSEDTILTFPKSHTSASVTLTLPFAADQK